MHTINDEDLAVRVLSTNNESESSSCGLGNVDEDYRWLVLIHDLHPDIGYLI